MTDPRNNLQKLATKQMKSDLHAHFLQNCIDNAVVPKGLRLNLKIHTSSESQDLQRAVDSLLKKVSFDIMERIVEDQRRYGSELSKTIEEERKKAIKHLSSEQLFETEADISENTEKEKDTVMQRHEKKLSNLITGSQHHSQLRSAVEPKNRIAKKTNSKITGKEKSSSNENTSIARKQTSKTSQSAQVKTAGTKPTYADVTRKAATAATATQMSKNATAPGTETNTEATRNGATTTLQQTLQDITNLLRAVLKNQIDGSLESRTKIHGGNLRRRNRRFKGDARR